MYKKITYLILLTALTMTAFSGPVFAQNKMGKNLSQAEPQIITLKDLTGKIERISPLKEKNQKVEEALIVSMDLGFDEVKNTKYCYNFIDINNDGKNELFVELYGKYVSGTGGNTALIFENKNGRYKLLQRFSVVHNPVIISDKKTNGFNDIIMYVCGGGAECGYAVLKYDGKNYPSNPSVEEKLPQNAEVYGKEIMNDDFMYSFSNNIG